MRRLARTPPDSALALVPAACRQQPEGASSVIGDRRAAEDRATRRTARSPPPDAVLLENVAPGAGAVRCGGNIVGGLAERWNVSDDGLSYIFRLAATNGRTAARSPRSKSRGS